jgi:hypothetical protein
MLEQGFRFQNERQELSDCYEAKIKNMGNAEEEAARDKARKKAADDEFNKQ